MNWYLDVLKNKYATFTGRARRKEYWWFALINFLVSFFINALAAALTSSSGTLAGAISVIGMLYSLAVLVPSLAVTVRRLHDIGRSGWWILIAFVPFIGLFILLIFTLFNSQPGSNEYGPNPKEGAVA